MAEKCRWATFTLIFAGSGKEKRWQLARRSAPPFDPRGRQSLGWPKRVVAEYLAALEDEARPWRRPRDTSETAILLAGAN
jgi:hypothetical protein